MRRPTAIGLLQVLLTVRFRRQEYTARQMEKAVVGRGQARKEQVQAMIA
ncbi:MAG TPA: crossover junction endodeoxyribonuclease RuvC, partial [Polyangia bacterium]